jgi:hypothetical protein
MKVKTPRVLEALPHGVIRVHSYVSHRVVKATDGRTVVMSLLGIPDAVIKGVDQKEDHLRHLRKTTTTLPSLRDKANIPT